MLRSLWQNLTRKSIRTTRRSPARAAGRRLGLETLEDRLALSTVNLAGSTLTINLNAGNPSAPGLLSIQRDQANSNLVDVNIVGGPSNQFQISQISEVNVTAPEYDNVYINYGNGLPFATGTNLVLYGDGSTSSDVLTLTGGVTGGTVSGNETIGRGTTSQQGAVSLGGATMYLYSDFGTVNDSVNITGDLVLQAYGTNVNVTGSNGSTQATGLAANGGGGNTVNFSNKAYVGLDLESTAGASLNSTTAAGIKGFSVFEEGNDDDVYVNTTAAGVFYYVELDAAYSSLGVGVSTGSLASIHGSLAVDSNSATPGHYLNFFDSNNTAGNNYTFEPDELVYGSNNQSILWAGPVNVGLFTAQGRDAAKVESTAAGDPVTIYSESTASSSITVAGNSSPVYVYANQNDQVGVGSNPLNGGSRLAFITANVTVEGAGNFFLDDSGNTSSEYVTVTESTITGLGASGVVISYGNDNPVILAGQAINSYYVQPSSATAKFTNSVTILDDSSNDAGIVVTLTTDAQASIDLHLYAANPSNSYLYVFNAAASSTSINYDGFDPDVPYTMTVSYPKGSPSVITYNFGYAGYN